MDSSTSDKKILLDALERAAALPLRTIRCSEVAPLPPGNWERPHSFNCVRVSLMLAGSNGIFIQYRGEWREIEFRAGEAMIYAPLSWTAYAPRRPGYSENLGLVMQPGFLRIVHSVGDPVNGDKFHSFHISKTLRASTSGLIDLLPDAIRSGDREGTAPMLLRQALRQARHDLAAAGENDPIRAKELWMRICAYLAENFPVLGLREETAEHFGITPGYLSNLFARYGRGRSFNRTVNLLRLESAARQLADGTSSCGEIARNCGFPSPSYFGMRFRSVYHCTPLEYRRRQQKLRED